jgi:hypothetical protein
MRYAVVVGVLAACGGGHPATGDGGGDATTTHDAAPDVVDATARGPITVTVYGDGLDRNQGVLVPGADVYFVEPDQTTTRVITGTDGVATAVLPNNTTVWVVHRDGSTSYFIDTLEGAQIGDSIVVGNPTPLGANTVIGAAYVAFPSFRDTTHYDLVLSCVGGPTPGSTSPIAPSFVACPQEMTANALVWATDSAGNLGYTSATGVDLTAHTSAGTALALPAFQPGATIGVTVTNLPASLGESSAQLRALYMMGTDPTPTQNIELREDTLTDTMTASAQIAPFGDHTRVFGQVYLGANEYVLDYDSSAAGLASDVTIDASMMVHPVRTAHYDAATSSTIWSQLAIGVDPTVVQTGLSWNTSVSVAWRLTAPYPGAPLLTFPAFPSEIASLIPSSSPTGGGGVYVTSYAGKTYHDALVGQTAGAASWRSGAGS